MGNHYRGIKLTMISAIATIFVQPQSFSLTIVSFKVINNQPQLELSLAIIFVSDYRQSNFRLKLSSDTATIIVQPELLSQTIDSSIVVSNYHQF